MTRSASRTAVALCLAALATGVPRARVERAATACACHHAGATPCTCARGAQRISGRSHCVSPCCKVPESARPPQAAPEPLALAARAAPLPPPAGRTASPETPASAVDRAHEPETPPPRPA